LAAATALHPLPSLQPQIDQLLSAREDINASLAGKGKLSVNDFIVKAAALACKKVGSGLLVAGRVPDCALLWG
jgi:pyruvate/2-oxoglutarate dehydrogenase complex dihydrolipoamide acyltransferase (E2) component